MRKYIYLLIPLSVLIACERIGDENLSADSSLGQDVTTRSGQLETIIIDHKVSLEEAEQIIEKQFPNEKVRANREINEDGEVVMYIVDFDSGWAIVAADDRWESSVIAFDNEGSFNPDDITNPGVSVWYEMQKERLSQLRKIKDEREVPVKTRSMNDYEPYYWLGFHIGTEYHSTNGEVDHLLDTKWGQGYPWNTKCPYYDIDSQCPAGCLAVATGQILYYLQVHKGFSVGLYHIVTPSFTQIDSTMAFIFNDMLYGDFNNPSSRWALMPKTSAYSNSYYSYVADLLVDIGYRFNFEYSSGGSGCVFIAPVFDTFNVDSYSGVFFFPYTKESLDDGFPVMVNAYQNADYTGGHSWVIDGYWLCQQTTDELYDWRIVPSDSLSYYSGYQFCYSESQKQQYVPDATEEEIYRISSTIGGNYLRMNWGWEGSYDSGYYSMSDYHWPDGYDNCFKYHPFITYNFSQEDEPEFN